MLWTILATLCVIGTRFITSLRLKDMNAKLQSIVPEVEALRRQVAQIQAENGQAKDAVEKYRARLGHLKDVIQGLEAAIRSPKRNNAIDERIHVLDHTKDN